MAFLPITSCSGYRGTLYFQEKKQNGFFQQLFDAVILGALQISKKKSQNDFLRIHLIQLSYSLIPKCSLNP